MFGIFADACLVEAANWHPFYEARFGVEIFVELCYSTLLPPVSSYVLERYITSYFIAFTIVVLLLWLPTYFITF